MANPDAPDSSAALPDREPDDEPERSSPGDSDDAASPADTSEATDRASAANDVPDLETLWGSGAPAESRWPGEGAEFETVDPHDESTTAREADAEDADLESVRADDVAATAIDDSGAVAAVEAADRYCPYLVAPDGWRSARPNRGQRCTAVRPSSRPALDRQASLCLARAHVTCELFVAARELRAGGGLPDLTAEHRPLARTTPLASSVERRPWRQRLGGLGPRPSPAAVGGLIVVLVAAIVLASTISSGAGAGGSATAASPSSATGSMQPSGSPPAKATPAAGTASAMATASATATEEPTSVPATPAPTPRPTTRPSASPSAAAASPTLAPGTFVRYKVKPGDTLSKIAAKYGTTVARILAANKIPDPSYLQIGQVIIVPK